MIRPSEATMPEAHITVRNLDMAYGDFVLQRNLNFTIRRGDIFIIMGGSGCGKSTLLKHLVGLMAPAKGQVLYSGTDFVEAVSERDGAAAYFVDATDETRVDTRRL